MSPAERSMAQLKFIADAKQQHSPGIAFADLVNVPAAQHPALALHLVYNRAFWQASPSAKMARLAQLYSEGLIDGRTRQTFELPYAIQMLSADQQFMAKSNDDKKAHIEKLRTEKVIAYGSQRELTKAFTAE